MGKFQDLTGQKFGKLTVISCVSEIGESAKYNCKCECGNSVIAYGHNLVSGTTKSCGCIRRNKARNLKFKHGKVKTRLYKCWLNMKNRCHNPNTVDYKNYGGRGITICPEWQEFEPFYEWAMANGYSDDLTIDRIDVNGNYEPDNCRWATMKEQSRNRTDNCIVEINGERKILQDWVEELGTYPKKIEQIGKIIKH